MELRVVRKNLMAQHDNIRTLMAALERVLDSHNATQIAEAARVLQEACEKHNAYEESVLEPILRDIDAWGPERVKQMLNDHSDEHVLLLKRLDAKSTPAQLRSTLAELRSHMRHEEATNLAENVLRDDVINVDAD